MENAILFLADGDFDLSKIIEGKTFWDFLSAVGLSILVWFIGSFAINRAVKLLNTVMEKRNMDRSLRPFLISLINASLKIMLLLAVASTLGMEVTSFVAILSAAAFAVGLALQGGLSNFAGGVMILMFKPFKVGDVIMAQGFVGAVHEIQIFNTILLNLENETIIIPNGPLSNGPIRNLTMQDTRRVTMKLGIGYSDDIDKARAAIEKVLQSCPEIIEPENTKVAVNELADSSVNFVLRPLVKTPDYWKVHAYVHEHVKKEFDAQGIGIPFQTLDVNITKG